MRTNMKLAHSDDVNIEVTQRKEDPGVWSVEIIDYANDGVIYITNFYGPQSRARADEYADWKRSQ